MNPLARRLMVLVPVMLLVASCGSESAPPKKPAPTPTVGASHRGHIDVLGAVFVMNDNGSATLSARLVNHTDDAAAISDAYFDGEQPSEWALRVFRSDHNVIVPNGKTALGGEDGPATIRVAHAPEAGDVVPFTLAFGSADEPGMSTNTIVLKVPVIERSAEYDTVAGNEPNTAIKVENARITVVPGQKKAYVDGTVVATISDGAWELPTAVDADGKPVAYRHQTATGGPYGISAEKGRRLEIGSGPPYEEGEGDADYFDAKDVTVGETISVTIPFQSGDVIVPFKVVAR